MIFITDELGNIEKNILELVENVGFKECKTIEAIDLFCGMSEKNDVLKEKDLYYAFIETPQYWSIRADGVNGAIYDNKTKMANIYFKNPIEKRMVSRVEWIDRNNTVYRIDYYNKYGYKYCSENVRGGNVISREFYDRNGDIKVMEQTGSKTYTTLGTGISPRSYRGFERCDIYLDINHYRELYNAVNQALINNMIILAFDNTAHSKELYPMGNIFDSSNYVKMKETLKNIITSQTIFNEYIDRQKKQLKQLAAKVVMGDTDESI